MNGPAQGGVQQKNREEDVINTRYKAKLCFFALILFYFLFFAFRFFGLERDDKVAGDLTRLSALASDQLW